MSGLDEGSPTRRGFWSGKRVTAVEEATRLDDSFRRVRVEYEDGTSQYVILSPALSKRFNETLNPFK